VSWKYLIKDY